MRLQSAARFALILVVAALLLAACAAAPGGARAAKPPAWLLAAPEPDAENSWFVGMASDPSGDQAAAVKAAAADIAAQLSQYIGVRLTVASSALARASLDSYSADITQSVTSESENRLAGFLVREKYFSKDKKTGGLTAYVLASYKTAELEREKARIAALFRELDESALAPEREGATLVAQGRLYDAALKYIDAAAAASMPGMDNAAAKITGNLRAARAAIQDLRLRFVDTSPSRLKIGQDFPGAARIMLSAASGAPQAGAALALGLQRRHSAKQGAWLSARTISLRTGTEGLAEYQPPPPDFAGEGRLIVALDMASALELLDRLPPAFAADRQALLSAIEAVRAELSYSVESAARLVPMALCVIELDERGGVSAETHTQAGLAEYFVREGCKVRTLAIENGVLSRQDDAGVLASARAASGAAGFSFERLVYGVARGKSVRADGRMFIAEVGANIRVVELSTGKILFSGERSATGLGADEFSARRSAFRNLGQNSFGPELLSSLP